MWYGIALHFGFPVVLHCVNTGAVVFPISLDECAGFRTANVNSQTSQRDLQGDNRINDASGSQNMSSFS